MPRRVSRRTALGGVLGGGVAALLGACGRAATGAASPTVLPMRATPAATPALAVAPSEIGYCPGDRIVGTPSPETPFVVSGIGEPAAIAFAERVRTEPLILLVAHPGYAPARWTTADGLRPANPHPATLYGDPPYAIITPERAEVVAVAKGAYALPAIWVAHYGGRIGRDCVSISPQTYPRDGDGLRFLYLCRPADFPEARPVPADPRYRFHWVTRFYTVEPTGLVTIGPEHDGMGNSADSPPRTLPLGDVLAAIATLTGIPATQTSH